MKDFESKIKQSALFGLFSKGDMINLLKEATEDNDNSTNFSKFDEIQSKIDQSKENYKEALVYIVRKLSQHTNKERPGKLLKVMQLCLFLGRRGNKAFQKDLKEKAGQFVEKIKDFEAKDKKKCEFSQQIRSAAYALSEILDGKIREEEAEEAPK